MGYQQRVDVELALRAILSERPEGSELLLTAFISAAQHYRKATICTPFPTELFAKQTNEKDFTACQFVIDTLPATSLLQDPQVLSQLPVAALNLLSWLLLHKNRKRTFTSITWPSFLHDLSARFPGFTPPKVAANLLPTCILRLEEGHNSQPFLNRVVAFHGTHTENLHSIIHTGLQNVSKTRLQRTGDLYGDGIYMSRDYDLAFSFCQASAAWTHSALGQRLKCMLVLEVDKEAHDKALDQDKDRPQLPPAYLVAQRADIVRLLYVLLYREDAPPVRRHINWCSVLVMLYLAGMLLYGLASKRYFKPY